MSIFRLLKSNYMKPLPFIMVNTTYLGFLMGITNNKKCVIKPLSYTGIGIISGIIYPVSLPIWGYYLLNNKQ